MPGATLANLNPTQRRHYIDRMAENAIGKKIGIYKRMSQSPIKHPQGQYFVTKVKLAMSGAGGPRSEHDSRSTSGAPVHEEALWQFAFDHQVVEETLFSQVLYEDTDETMFSDALAALIDRTHMNMWLPRTGLLATHSATAGTGATSIRVQSRRYLRLNQMVDVLLKTTGEPNSIGVLGARITGHAPISGSTDVAITLDKSVGLYSSLTTTYGLYTAGSYNKHPNGLVDIINDTDPDAGALGGIARATGINYLWKSPKLSLGGPWDSQACDQLLRAIQFNANMGEDGNDPARGKIGVCNGQLLNVLIGLGMPLVQFNGVPEKFNLWGKGVMLGTLPVLQDDYCPDGEFFIIHPEYLRFHRPTKVSTIFWWPVDKNKITGGLMRMIPVESKFSSYTTACCFWQMTPKLCAAHGRITNISVPAPRIGITY